MNFAKILKELRKEYNLTHKELAEKLGLSKASISFWENEVNEPTANALITLSNFFNVSVDYLLGRETEDGIIVIPNKNNIESSKDYRLKEIEKIFKELKIQYQAKLLAHAKILLELQDSENIKVN